MEGVDAPGLFAAPALSHVIEPDRALRERFTEKQQLFRTAYRRISDTHQYESAA